MTATDVPAVSGDFFAEGRRVGRYVLLRDLDGVSYAVSAGAVAVMCEDDDGCALVLSGGRSLVVPRSMRTVLSWFETGCR